jgi:CHAT domain-containing protein/tetratricopeptide (TPR) repeat protein
MNSHPVRLRISLGILSLLLVVFSFTLARTMHRRLSEPDRQSALGKDGSARAALSSDPWDRGVPIPAVTEIRALIAADKKVEAQKKILQALDAAMSRSTPDPNLENQLLFALVITVYNAGGALTRNDDHLLDRLVQRMETEASRDPVTGAALISRANVLIFQGRYAEARAVTQRAATLQKALLGDNHPDFAKGIAQLAHISSLMGELSKSVVQTRRLVRILENQGTVSPDLAGALMTLSDRCRKIGDLNQARIAAERAVSIDEQLFGPKAWQLAMALDALADVQRDLGNFQAAKSLSERAVANWFDGKTEPATLGAGMMDLGLALAGLGENDRAMEIAKRAVRMAEDYLGPGDRRMGWYWSRLGELCERTGDYEGAMRAYLRGREVYASFVGTGHASIGLLDIRLAAMHLHRGDLGDALECALRGEEVTRGQFLDVEGVLSEKAALLYESNRKTGLEAAATVLVRREARSDDAVRRYWNEVIHSRGLVLMEMAARNHLLAAHDNARLSEMAASLTHTRNQLSALVMRSSQALDAGTVQDELEALRTGRETLEQSIAEESVQARDLGHKASVGLSDVLEALPAESALLSFVAYERISPEPKGEGKVPTRPERTPCYLALLQAAKGSHPMLVDLGPAGPIDDAIRAWREQVGSPSSGLQLAGEVPEAAYRRAGERLRKLVWDPLPARIQEARQIFVVPDGSLTLLSLATLPAKKEGYLLESGPVFHYLSAERDLVKPKTPPVKGQGILSIGGPDFDGAGIRRVESSPLQARLRDDKSGRPEPQADLRGATASCADFRKLRFDPLPGAADEAREIKTLWSGISRLHETSAGEARLLVGNEADETVFKQIAPSYAVLHLATHGFFLEESCDTIASPGHSGAAVSSRFLDDPLLLSGLALARANSRADAEGGADDGILTAEEITSLDLSGVRWVVLSACDTGLGRIQPGEGVLGLRRAFEAAGAATVIMSLWKVEDTSTREWMRALYEGRLQGMSTIEAVRHASKSLLDSRRARGRSTHPFFWGAFVATGDWR